MIKGRTARGNLLTKKSVHRITLDDAIADGLYKRICYVTGQTWSPEAEKKWRDDLYRNAPNLESAEEEYGCVPKNSGGAWLSRALIESRMSPYTPIIRWECQPGFEVLPDHVRMAERWATARGPLQAMADGQLPAFSAEHEAARVQYEAKLKLQGLQSAAEVEVELAAANVNKAQSQIRIFDAQVAQCAFVAPFTGKVARVHVKVGQGVNPGAPVIELVGNGAPRARMNVPSQWLAWLKTGETLQGKVDETGAEVALKVIRISGRVDAVSQSVEIETELVSARGQVLPGMSGQVRAPAGR